MTIHLDEQTFVESRLPAGATVQELVRTAQGDLAGTGRILIGLRCGGEEVSPEALERMLGEPVSRFERIQLISERPRQVVLKILNEAREAFRESAGMAESAATALIAGRVGEAMNILGEAAGAWGMAHESVVKSAALLRVDPAQLTMDGRPASAWLVELASRLRDIKGAVEARDHVLLGDLLRYEFDGTLAAWSRFLDAFIDQVRTLPDDEGAAARRPAAVV